MPKRFRTCPASSRNCGMGSWKISSLGLSDAMWKGWYVLLSLVFLPAENPFALKFAVLRCVGISMSEAAIRMLTRSTCLRQLKCRLKFPRRPVLQGNTINAAWRPFLLGMSLLGILHHTLAGDGGAPDVSDASRHKLQRHARHCPPQASTCRRETNQDQTALLQPFHA